MKFDLYTDMALERDVPEHRLRRGDIVNLVDHHVAPDGTEGYSIKVRCGRFNRSVQHHLVSSKMADFTFRRKVAWHK